MASISCPLMQSPLLPPLPYLLKVLLVKEQAPCDWHFSLGHPSSQAITYTTYHFQLSLTSKIKLPFCTTCSQAKTHALSHPSSFSRSHASFYLLFLVVWRPSLVLSTNGSQFYLSIVDDFSN